jgi:hypothetical protein
VQHKEDNIIVLRIRSDSMMSVTFAEVLGANELYSIKLPTVISKYRYGYLLDPTHVINVQLVKTRIHWILTNIDSSNNYLVPVHYEDHIKITQLTNFLLSNIKEGQQTDIQKWIIEELPKIIFKEPLEIITEKMMKELGW